MIRSGIKLNLPTVTLLCVDCIDINRVIKVIERCKYICQFGAVKLLTSIPNDYQHSVTIMPLNSLIAYSIFMLTRVYQYIDTPHVLIVQRDGWILNPESFDPAWLELDYIGPLFVQYDKVGSGGFSLRSKKCVDEMARLTPSWDGTIEHANKIQAGLGYYEDGVISLSPHKKFFKIGSNEQAANFAQGGNRNPVYLRDKPFGWHRTWQKINFETGIVDSSDTSNDLQSSYDKDIDALLHGEFANLNFK